VNSRDESHLTSRWYSNAVRTPIICAWSDHDRIASDAQTGMLMSADSVDMSTRTVWTGWDSVRTVCWCPRTVS